MRFERRDGALVEAPVAGEAVTAEAGAEAPVEARPERSDRPERGERGERGDRGDRGDRDRGDRGDRRDRFESRRDRDRDRDRDRPRRDQAETIAEIRTEEAPAAVEAAPAVEPTKVDDVAARALERADRGSDKKGKKKEVTAETREFWETWAEEKSTRVAEAPAEAAAEAPAETTEAAATEGGEERPRRDRDRGRGRDRDRGGRGEKRREKAEVLDRDKSERRTKRDTAVSAPPVAGSSAGASTDAQARLFVSLGKKHGVSADDLRTLLAGPLGGDTARIGSVSLRDSHAHVRVPEDTVDAIVAAINGTQHNEHEVTVERARA